MTTEALPTTVARRRAHSGNSRQEYGNGGPQPTTMRIFKQTTLVLFLLLGAYATQAQVALKAGVNFSNMLFEEDEQSVEDLARNGAVKFIGGLSFILPLGNAVAIQPELLFAQKGAETTLTILGEDITTDYTYNYLDIPLLLRLSLGDTHGEGLGIYVNGGVYAGYAFSGKTNTSSVLGNFENDIEFDGEDDQRRLDYGFALGGGLTLGNLFFDLRYTHGTNNLLDDDANNNNDNGLKTLQHRGLALTTGLIF
ncbi:MAG: porin family protein [Bacteroidota bacterium]